MLTFSSPGCSIFVVAATDDPHILVTMHAGKRMIPYFYALVFSASPRDTPVKYCVAPMLDPCFHFLHLAKLHGRTINFEENP